MALDRCYLGCHKASATYEAIHRYYLGYHKSSVTYGTAGIT